MAEEPKATVPPVDTTAGSADPASGHYVADVGSAGEAKQSMSRRHLEKSKVDGDAEHTASEPSKNADAAAPQNEDTEMANAGEVSDADAAGSAQPAAAAASTPASTKKASNGSSKKKSSGVPEHKSKKLNKKKSKQVITHLDAQPGEYYLARMKGHPPWPSVICDEEMLPQSLIDTRPVTTRQPDGSFKKPDYADGGKRAHERTFPIMFLTTNEFAWMPNTDLTKLDPSECANVDSKGKSKNLVAAFAQAAQNQSLDHFKQVLQDHQAALQEDANRQAEREAKKATKAKRKSDASALAEDGDDMDVDEEQEAPKPKSKKRKKEAADSDEAEEKPAKTPKTSTKLKLSTPKTPATEPSKKKAAPKPKASTGKKAVAKTTSDDDAADSPTAEEKAVTAEEKHEKRDRLVLYYRHKLQRGFLSRDTMPKEEEMKSMSDFLKELEGLPLLEASIIRHTKINKVLKAMIKLPSIPLDEEFKFKSRAHDLLQQWNETLANDPTAAGGEKDDRDNKAEASTSGAAATTNGEKNDTEKQAKQAEAGEAAAPEEEGKEKLENKIGTTTEGEKEADKADTEMTDKPVEEPKTDAPAVETAPAAEYKPATVEEAAA